MVGAAFIVVIIVFAIGIRLSAGAMDRERVSQYIEDGGGQVLDIRWEPLGPGWFGEKSDRIYEIAYRDRKGNEHMAHAKTSLWTGVYLTEDQIVKHVERPGEQETAALEEENQRLREELRELKEGRG